MQWRQGFMLDGEPRLDGADAFDGVVEGAAVDVAEANGADSLGALIKVANTLIERELNNRVSTLVPGLDLTGPQVTLLVYLYDSKGRTVTQKEIADRFVLSHPTIRGIVRRLEKAGLIDLSSLSQDRRQVVLSLSKRGFEIIDRHIDAIRAVMEDVNRRIVGPLDEDQQECFAAELRRIIRAF